MRVRRHVVEPGPRLVDPAAGGRRVSGARSRASRSAKTESSTVGLEAPARLGVGHRKHQPVAATAEMEAGLGLDDHRQPRGRRCEQLGREQLPAERPDRQLDADPSTELRRPRPAGDHERVGGSRGGRSASVCSRTSTPSSAGTADELLGSPRADRQRRPRHRTPPRGRPRVSSPATNDASTLSTGTPSEACSSRRSSSVGQTLLGRRDETGSRPGRRRAARARRRTRCSPAPAAPRPRSRTAGGRLPSPDRSSPSRSRRDRRERRRVAPRSASR